MSSKSKSEVTPKCQKLVGDVDEVLGCGVVDLATGRPLGFHHKVAFLNDAMMDVLAAAAVDLFRGKTINQVETLLSKQSGRDKMNAMEELFINTRGAFIYMSILAEPQRAVVLVTEKTITQAMGWIILRNLLDELNVKSD